LEEADKDWMMIRMGERVNVYGYCEFTDRSKYIMIQDSTKFPMRLLLSLSYSNCK